MTGRPTIQGLRVDLRRAQTRKGREDLGAYVIEGTRLFERALRSEVSVRSVICSQEYYESTDPRHQTIVSALEQRHCDLRVQAQEDMDLLTAGRKFGAIMGLVELPTTPAINQLEVMKPACAPLLLAAVDIEDPGNVGALTRTALAGGASALVTTGIADAFHPRAVRTSMGAVFKLPVISMPTDSLLEELRRYSTHTVAAVLQGGLDSTDIIWTGTNPVAILMGNESHGLPARIADACLQRTSLVQSAALDSFSVNAAAAILLHDAYRARVAAT